MNTSQTTLTDDTDDHSPPTDDGSPVTDDTDTTETTTDSGEQTPLAPPEQRGGKHCCPWCLAAPEAFQQHGDGRPRCGFCDAAIPVGAEWFERGEKIVV